MKRSEILDIIEAELYMVQNIKGNNQEFLKSIAIGIIDRIEEVGMLPPNIDGDRYYHCYECGGDSVFRWEPEDD